MFLLRDGHVEHVARSTTHSHTRSPWSSVKKSAALVEHWHSVSPANGFRGTLFRLGVVCFSLRKTKPPEIGIPGSEYVRSLTSLRVR